MIDAGDLDRTQDVEEANELLDAAGLAKDGDVRKLPDGTPMAYDINVVSGWSDWVSACQIIAQNLEDIGIKAKVQTYDFAAWFDRVQKGDFDLSIGWSSQGATPFNYYRGLMSQLTVEPVGEVGAENWHRYVNAEADALLSQFAATADAAEQKDDRQPAPDSSSSENAPAIPLFPGPQWGRVQHHAVHRLPERGESVRDPLGLREHRTADLITTIKPERRSS